MPQVAGSAQSSRRSAAWRIISPLLVLAVLFGSGPLFGARIQASLSTEFVVIGANAVVGGLTSGLTALARGEPFLRSFSGGLAGGSVHYLGKRIAVGRAPGAGLSGRLVGAVGMSMVRNAGEGRGLLDRLLLPVGPVVVDWMTVPDSSRVRARLHLGRTVFLGVLAWHDELRIDWGETLLTGAPVFRTRDRLLWDAAGSRGGLELFGSISIRDRQERTALEEARLIAHERVHVLQDDFLTYAMADPVEDWLLELVPGGGAIAEYVDFGLVYLGMGGLLLMALPYEDRPWENEASHLSGGP